MESPDRAMEIYLRLLAERIDEAMSREDVARLVAEIGTVTDPELIRQVLADYRRRVGRPDC